jgi:hypothetical protein
VGARTPRRGVVVEVAAERVAGRDASWPATGRFAGVGAVLLLLHLSKLRTCARAATPPSVRAQDSGGAKGQTRPELSS